ncbi:uncharacterized protein EV422DRAFT_568996 [Fimicolochytrium jonesii]|uniref:uncharacterized protein n=1 Tax=Fimicolochytrium jonesii TaxID=1396493 RepID=UPI0022FE97FF|nr:uncharacterized protein EV422DRAFT_568996 [Fimicolochytrium jonesii]KAI8819136.1 hypothetical protein EV422DRAFT_568996 [Fimicolochytrium jonesii]
MAPAQIHPPAAFPPKAHSPSSSRFVLDGMHDYDDEPLPNPIMPSSSQYPSPQSGITSHSIRAHAVDHVNDGSSSSDEDSARPVLHNSAPHNPPPLLTAAKTSPAQTHVRTVVYPRKPHLEPRDFHKDADYDNGMPSQLNGPGHTPLRRSLTPTQIRLSAPDPRISDPPDSPRLTSQHRVEYSSSSSNDAPVHAPSHQPPANDLVQRHVGARMYSTPVAGTGMWAYSFADVLLSGEEEECEDEEDEELARAEREGRREGVVLVRGTDDPGRDQPIITGVNTDPIQPQKRKRRYSPPPLDSDSADADFAPRPGDDDDDDEPSEDPAYNDWRGSRKRRTGGPPMSTPMQMQKGSTHTPAARASPPNVNTGRDTLMKSRATGPVGSPQTRRRVVDVGIKDDRRKSHHCAGAGDGNSAVVDDTPRVKTRVPGYKNPLFMQPAHRKAKTVIDLTEPDPDVSEDDARRKRVDKWVKDEDGVIDVDDSDSRQVKDEARMKGRQAPKKEVAGKVVGESSGWGRRHRAWSTAEDAVLRDICRPTNRRDKTWSALASELNNHFGRNAPMLRSRWERMCANGTATR